MDYNSILSEIKPGEEEINKVRVIVDRAIDFINNKAKEEGINATAILVGSIAKGTWLSGAADIDIFITFSLDISEEELKEKGLYLAYECNNGLGGIASEQYASHPYLNSYIDGYNVDIVPSYKIEDGSQLKSAVDRTTLHTEYIIQHLKEEEKAEVLLLKKFMKEVGVYGSEFKVGGFPGYLCELLIIQYGTFENTLKNASNWRAGTVVDLEDYKTSKLFKDDLIVVDPTDKNRNVAAALTPEKMAEFIAASRNFIENPKEEYFFPIKRKEKSTKDLLDVFQERQTKTIAISFNIPDISTDNIYPQLKKSTMSLKEKLEEEGFTVLDGSYWSDEDKIAILIVELDTWILGKYELNVGPKIYYKKASEEFLKAHKGEAFLKDGYWTVKKERTIKTPENFIKHTFTEKNLHILKIGKNLKETIVNSYKLYNIEEFLTNNNLNNLLNNKNKEEEFLNFLDDYLFPSQHLKR
ncbi:MAG: CCA tRNA nucleotidyltransferase [Methanobrevibacter sp.]|jgi:tRNA nucleotidyltransferase (CCA-adding enzyme)|nr:CCA tRNA nucleotidyltransferase [Methanobrevibacter sp.]